MKANELNIGDWVSFNPNAFFNGEPEWNDVIIETGDDIDDAKSGCYKPIPLTEEILKANGFVHKDGFEEWWHYDEFPFSDFQLNDSYDEVMDEWCVSIRINNCDYNIHYVHELQHALRLCGLTDLADNFELKVMEE